MGKRNRVRGQVLTAAVSATLAAASFVSAQTWTYDANVYPSDGAAAPSPWSTYVTGTTPTIQTEGATDFLHFDTSPNGGTNYAFYTVNPADWNVSLATGYSYEWRARMDAATPTNPSSAMVLAGNASNYSFMRAYNNNDPGSAITLPLTVELQSGGGPSVSQPIGNPYAWHTYRVDVQGSTHTLYVDNYPSPILSANLGSGAANTLYFGDGTATDNGKYDVDYVRTWQSGIVGAPAAPSRTSISNTLFAAHFDGTTGNGGMDADYALGSRAVVANPLGGRIDSPGKFGDGAANIVGGNGVIQYQTAGNFNVAAGAVEMWIKPDAPISQYQGLFGTFASAGDIRLQITSSGQLQAYMAAGGSSWSLTSAASLFPDTNWHHVAFGWDFNANKAALYLDGVIVDNTIDFSNLPGLIDYLGVVDSTFQIGRIQNGSARFEGLIDEFRISGIDVFGGLNFTPETSAYALPGNPQWNVNAGGDYSTSGNWLNGVPNAPDAVANFGMVITAPQTVNLDAGGAPYTAGAINFNNANAYTLSGTETITLDVSLGSAQINVATGSHTISAPLALAKSTVLRVTPAGSTLTISGDMTAASGVTVTKTGNGSAVVKNVRADGLVVNQGTLRMIADSAAGGTSKVGSLGVNPGAKLDLAANKIVTSTAIGTHNGTNYTGITGLIELGRNGGVWDGPGITTSMSDATGGSGYTVLGVATAMEARGLGASTDTDVWGGQTVTGSDTLVMYTYGGDANLSGFVDVDDYGLIDFNAALGGVLTGWFNGDFDYNGFQDVDDYGIIDFTAIVQGAPFPTGAGVGLNINSVPEPAALSSLALLTLLHRRKRRA